MGNFQQLMAKKKSQVSTTENTLRFKYHLKKVTVYTSE